MSLSNEHPSFEVSNTVEKPSPLKPRRECTVTDKDSEDLSNEINNMRRALRYSQNKEDEAILLAAEGKLALKLAKFRASVEEMLREVNGRATQFATSTFEEVLEIVRRVEDTLSRSGIPSSNRGGVVVEHTRAGPTAKAYRYSSKATCITLKRFSSGTWKLMEARSVQIRPKSPERLSVKISQEVADLIVKKALCIYSVR